MANKEVRDFHRRMLLCVAVCKGRLAMVQLLIEHGANDNATENGRTTLIHASRYGEMAVVEYLLKQGCSRDHTINNFRTTQYLAANNGHLETAQLLRRLGANL